MLRRAVGQQPAARATVPSSLLVHLHELVPGFAAEVPRDQWSLAVMLWACAEGGRPHKRWPDMFSFSIKDIREMWGEDVRMHRVVGSRYFTAHQGNNLTEVTNGYAPSIEMAEALVRTINSKVDELVDAQGRSRVPYGKAIASMAAPAKDGAGNRQSKWNGAEPTKFVPIDVDALQRYREELMDVWSKRVVVERAIQWMRRQIRSIDVVLKIGRNTRAPGCFPIKYREGSTGRISAEGHSLQSMPGLVRSAALAGKWDYDISTAQWTLLSQMASRLGIECPLTDAYIADKRSLRRRVSEGAGITLDDAKKCITALLFGAVVQHSEKAMRWHPGDLVKGIGAPAALRLCDQPDFMDLYDEIGRVGDAVVKAWPRHNGRLFNDLRIQHQSGSELAHLLQGAEAAVLRAVVKQQQGNILLCVHDGWVAQERLDVDALVDHIQTESGYRVGIEEDELMAPGSDRIKHKLDEFEAFSQGELRFVCPFAVAQGEWSPLGGPEVSRSVRPGAGRPLFTPSDEAGLWTLHPHPGEPVLDRLAFVSPRPAWNLPSGSTADYVDRKRQEAAANSTTRRRSAAAQLPE